ncbi:unnamed protein product [Bemisia tabaci]|uniref:Transcription elongation regulator 1 n=1 Tax=Bemisia tabaci TaxID=7038 RepID=A0A9P0FZG5_BEMTA|nr:unnamed protein product [Bemisia tabaci]
MTRGKGDFEDEEYDEEGDNEEMNYNDGDDGDDDDYGDHGPPDDGDFEFRRFPMRGRGRGGFRARGRGMHRGRGDFRGGFRGRGFGPRGPGFRGGPGGPFGPRGPRFRGGPPNWDGPPNWGPPPPGMMGPGGPGMCPPPNHMMMNNGQGPMGMGPPFGPPPGMGPQGGPGGPPPGMMGPGGPPPMNGPGMMGGPMNRMPPPNMGMPPPNMGQPPMGGMPPMNMPPPGGAMSMAPNGMSGMSELDFSGEIWVETKSGEGKSYYYNARTRETTWTKPEGGEVKIISQEQVEQMAQAARMTGQTGAIGAAATTESGDATKPDDLNNSTTNQSSDSDFSQIQGPPPGMTPFGAPAPFGGPPPFGMPPPGFGGPGPGPGQYPGWGMTPPTAQPISGQPVMNPVAAQANAVPNEAPAAAVAAPSSQIDPEILARAAEWTEHKAPDGRFYYFNAKLGSSVWEKPQALKDLETAKLAAAQGISVSSSAVITGSASLNSGVKVNDVTSSPAIEETKPALMNGRLKDDHDDGEDHRDDSNSDSESHKKEWEHSTSTGNAFNSSATATSTGAVDEASAKKNEEEEKAKEAQKAQDRSKPVSSTPIPGTPWCVVWTGDGRVFFYNPSSRTSVWERPEDLQNRPDVDKLVSTPPEVVSTTAATENKEAVKREHEADLDSSAAKKPKLETAAVKEEETKVEKKQIDIGKEAAMEAEVRAARERAIVPLEIRINSFREMLTEKEVSAFSTWEKELHKIVFDPRYLLLTSKERKQVFEKYVKERAEEERKEKRNKMKERKDQFRKLMEEANLHGKSSFADFAQKFSRDERFKNLEKMREREGLFNEYLLEVRKREKEEKSQRRDQVRKDFFALLRESSEVTRHSRWSEVKKKLDNDSRYRAVDSSSTREDWFREYIKILKDERKREKEKDRDKDKKDRDRKEDSKEKDAESDEGAVNSESEREQREAEKQARVEASLRERQKEVERTLAVHLRDRDNEREQHKHDEAVQHFNALLADLVRNSELAWREAKRQLRKDHRWDLAELLSRDEKEKLFNEHIELLSKKKKEKFRQLLDETSEVKLSSNWKDVKKLIKDDPRYSKISWSDRKLEREFKDYVKDKLADAKTNIKELLMETKHLTYKSRELIRENEAHMQEVEEILKKDRRYLVLDHLPEERTELVLSYLDELEQRGPPPPPTASDPSRRGGINVKPQL